MWLEDEQRSLSWRLRISFAIDAARALAFLHSKNILHRDVKGENLLVSENGRIKLCDFGLSRLGARNEQERSRLSYFGTNGYMAPEIMKGMPFDAAVDVFSYGVTLCEIICRRPVGQNYLVRVVPGLGLDPDSIRSNAEPGCPDKFINLAISCTASDPKDRPNWKFILEELRLVETNLPNVEHAGTFRVKMVQKEAGKLRIMDMFETTADDSAAPISPITSSDSPSTISRSTWMFPDFPEKMKLTINIPQPPPRFSSSSSASTPFISSSSILVSSPAPLASNQTGTFEKHLSE